MNRLDTHALMSVNVRPEPIMVRGEGSFLWDEAGRRYLDFVQGWAVNCLGHCPAAVQRALSAPKHSTLASGGSRLGMAQAIFGAAGCLWRLPCLRRSLVRWSAAPCDTAC